jgi:hypothetical protein
LLKNEPNLGAREVFGKTKSMWSGERVLHFEATRGWADEVRKTNPIVRGLRLRLVSEKAKPIGMLLPFGFLEIEKAPKAATGWAL